MKQPKKPLTNRDAINKLAQEFSLRLPTLLAHNQRRFKAAVIRAMIKTAVERMKPKEMKEFLSMWRHILGDMERERMEKVNHPPKI